MAWVVGTGPAEANGPWVEQWFFFGDQSVGGTYGDYPGLIPEGLYGKLLSDPPLPQGHAKFTLRPGRRRHFKRRELRDLRRKPGAYVQSTSPIVWYTYPPTESDIGLYHAAVHPANDDPKAFFNRGLKDLLDEFGRADLDGPIGYVYGETWRRPDRPLSTNPALNDFVEDLCGESEGAVSVKVVKLYRGSTLVGFAYSSHKQSNYQEWSHRRGVHQFMVDGVQMHVPNNQTEMMAFPQPDNADWSTAKHFAAWLANGGGDWPRYLIQPNTGPAPCDYYYGCAYVTLDCDPDQNDRPQTPSQYPGS